LGAESDSLSFSEEEEAEDLDEEREAEEDEPLEEPESDEAKMKQKFNQYTLSKQLSSSNDETISESDSIPSKKLPPVSYEFLPFELTK
jgi:hypothetical protein